MQEDSTANDPAQDFGVAGAFDRLRWSILDPKGLAAIQIEAEDPDIDAELTQYSASHPVAKETATLSGARRLAFHISPFQEYESEWADGVAFPEPDQSNFFETSWDIVLIEREDKAPLLVHDVLSRLNDFFQQPVIQGRIRESLGWMCDSKLKEGPDGRSFERFGPDDTGFESVPENRRIMFEYLQDNGGPVQKGDEHGIVVYLWVEGAMGQTVEDFRKNGPR